MTLISIIRILKHFNISTQKKFNGNEWMPRDATKNSWNPVRILRRKTSKKSKESAKQDAAEHADSACIECREEELGNRVKQWLKDSKPPISNGRKKMPIFEFEEISEDTEDTTYVKKGKVSDAGPGILYHPDFADWKSSMTSTSSPPKIGPSTILDDAILSFSDFFRVPFNL